MSRAVQRLPIPALKILSDSLDRFECRNGMVFYGNKRVYYVEVAGVCIETGRKFVRALDFCGEVFMTHDEGHVMLDTSYIFLCRPYFKDGVVRLHCRATKRIDIFEEIFFWAEAANLRRQGIIGEQLMSPEAGK